VKDLWTFGASEPVEVVRTEAPLVQDAVEFARSRLGFEPDEQQRRVLLSMSKRGILNCSRQWGKSTTVAAKAVHRAYMRPGSLVLVASPSGRQSAEFVRKASGMLVRLGIKPRGDGDNEWSLLFPNGSRIVGLPGTMATLRGFSSASMLLIDEAAWVPDELYTTLSPTLAVSGGDVWMMSTPFGRRGFFYMTWAHGGAGWERISVPATECPRIPEEHLEEERGRMGDEIFRREYMCEFVDRGAGCFDLEVIERAIRQTVRPLNMGWRLSNF
jgi:hypothetical protein